MGTLQKTFLGRGLSLRPILSRKGPVAAVVAAELVVAQAAVLEVGQVVAAADPGEPVELEARAELAAEVARAELAVEVVRVELAEPVAGRVVEMAARREAAHPLARR